MAGMRFPSGSGLTRPSNTLNRTSLVPADDDDTCGSRLVSKSVEIPMTISPPSISSPVGPSGFVVGSGLSGVLPLHAESVITIARTRAIAINLLFISVSPLWLKISIKLIGLRREAESM